MANDTRRLILEKTYELFVKQGYSATGMRQIADACSIRLGNLCYHFNKKEDIFMHFYREIFSAISLILTDWLDDNLEPWSNFLAREYCFLYKCTFDLKYRNVCADVVNIPILRYEYINSHKERFIEIFGKENLPCDEQKILVYSTIVCAAEFQLMDSYEAQYINEDFDDFITTVFKVHMNLLGVPASKQDKYIKEGIKAGKDVLSKNMALIDL